jgi:hypothetical protein
VSPATRSPPVSEGGPLGAEASLAPHARWLKQGARLQRLAQTRIPSAPPSKQGAKGLRQRAQGPFEGLRRALRRPGARPFRLVRLNAGADRAGAGDHTLSAVSIAHRLVSGLLLFQAGAKPTHVLNRSSRHQRLHAKERCKNEGQQPANNFTNKRIRAKQDTLGRLATTGLLVNSHIPLYTLSSKAKQII